VEVPLTPLGAISGSIRDVEGRTISNATVEVLQPSYEAGVAFMSRIMATKTDDRGEYRFFGLNRGSYYLAMHSNAGIKTYYPGSMDLALAAPILVDDGTDMVGVELREAISTVHNIRGKIFTIPTVGPSATPPSFYISRRAALRDTPVPLDGFADSTGSFEIDRIPSGSYELFATLRENMQVYTGHISLDIDDDILDFSLPVVRSAQLQGIIRTSSNTTLMSSFRVSLSAREALPPSAMPATVSCDSDGRFVIGNVAIGVYEIRILGLPQDMYVAEVKQGDTGSSDVHIDKGVDRATVQVVVGESGGRIDGIVEDSGQARSGITVVLAPEQLRRDKYYLFRSATADQDGQFTIRGIAPGSYKLFAWRGAPKGIERAAGFLQKYESLGTSVQVQSSASSFVRVPFITGISP
jgi:hypothetical protein